MSSLQPGQPGYQLARVFKGKLKRLGEIRAGGEKALQKVQAGQSNPAAEEALKKHLAGIDAEIARQEAEVRRLENGGDADEDDD